MTLIKPYLVVKVLILTYFIEQHCLKCNDTISITIIPAEKSRAEFCKFAVYLIFPRQPYKKWSLMNRSLLKITLTKKPYQFD